MSNGVKISAFFLGGEWNCSVIRIFTVRYRKLGKPFAVEIFATGLVIPSGEDEVLFGSHDTQIIRVQRSPGFENCLLMYKQ